MAIVFFGTFDPFHENHFRLVEYVAKTYQPRKIAIIPNSDAFASRQGSQTNGSGFKSGSLALKIRLSTVRERLQHLTREQESLQRIVEIVDPGSTITNWSGRQKLACQFGKKHGLPVLYVLVGLDSLESSLRRTGHDRNHGYTYGINPLDNFILKLLVIPRLGYTLPDIPEKYQSKIKIDQNYHESVKVSSTLIRQLVRSRLPIKSELCHPNVVEYLVKNNCYQTPEVKIPEFEFNSSDDVKSTLSVVVFMGSPGSGKSSLAVYLAKETGYLFISTGDLYRYEKENNTECYKILEMHRGDPLVFREALSQYILFKIHKLIEDYLHVVRDQTEKKRGIIIEGFKAGDLKHFTEHGWEIDTVIYVDVNRDALEERVRERNLTRKDESAFTHRVDTYYNVYLGEIKSELDVLQAQGSVKKVLPLDNNGNWETTTETLLNLMIEKPVTETTALVC